MCLVEHWSTAKIPEIGYKNDKMQVGVSAQEVNAILPEVISLAPFDIEFDEKTRTEKSKSLI